MMRRFKLVECTHNLCLSNTEKKCIPLIQVLLQNGFKLNGRVSMLCQWTKSNSTTSEFL